ncbi:MAG: hypothetical protein NTU66_02825 [Elusimicrobia bacterium]|nr:hypothetical protein [Elusimicrobiota bacterium]
MSLQEFIRLETEALSIVNEKDRTMAWKAVECGAMEKVRLYAESVNYEIGLTDVTDIIWTELCDYLTPKR